MKKTVSLVLCAVLLISAALCASSCAEKYDTLRDTPTGDYSLANELAGTTINVFNWGLLISDGSEGSLDVVRAFENLTGINVNYTYYDSNEAMYAKMKSGAVAYDVIIPSDYMIQRLKSENMLQKLDFSLIDNYKYISEDYKDLYFDENNEYSVPYDVGMVGLIYNKTMVEEAPTSWGVMWDERYADNILTFDNSRDGFAIAQFLLGISLNTTDTAEWDRAAAKLREQSPLLQARVMDKVFNKMESGNAAIAPYYAGDFLTMKDNNDDLEFVYPEEGTNIFVDSMCVPANAKNARAAMLFINYMLEPEVALANAEYICYATPHTAVLANEDYSLRDNEILYPAAEDMPKTEYYHDLDKAVRTYFEGLWEDIVTETNK